MFLKILRIFYFSFVFCFSKLVEYKLRTA